MKNFSLLHIVLYAKDWYAKEQNQTIWDDLKVIFTLDDYMGEHMTKNDMINVLLNECQLLDISAFNLTTFATGIDQRNSYRFGYYTKGCPMVDDDSKLPEWDYHEAIVRYCLSALRFTGKDKLPKMPFPNYKDGLPKRKGITIQDLKKHFGTKREENIVVDK